MRGYTHFYFLFCNVRISRQISGKNTKHYRYSARRCYHSNVFFAMEGKEGALSLPALAHPSGSAGATSRNHRGFSRKLQDMLKRQGTHRDERGGERRAGRERFEARNWKQLSERQLCKLTAIERSRYLAYEPAPKEMQERKMEALRRLRVSRGAERVQLQGPTLHQLIEREKNSELMGQLKAAEAQQRIQFMRMSYDRAREEELTHLIASQPSSIEAVRLKTFVSPHPQPLVVPELLSRHERVRCETLLEDNEGLTINRTA